MYHLNTTSKISDQAPCHMVYRTFSIGTNENSDLCLAKYGKICEYASNKHACIYYDEYSNHYELLNYSENGTVVDNILFSNDITMKQLEDNDDDDVDDDENSSSFNDDSDESFINNNDNKPKMSSKLSKNYWSCKCKCSLTDVFAGKCWEGSAILNHGSHIKFGCLEFVFCIIGYDMKW
jgi:hypothetical protein